MIVAVDGLAASGKGTIARAFASAYGFAHIDAGLVFRASVYVHIRTGLAINSDLWRSRLRYEWDTKCSHVYFDGVELDVSLMDSTHAHRVSEVASRFTSFFQLAECVRFVATDYPDIICDGRSIASDIFPNCDAAFRIDAGLAVRSFRRWKDLRSAGFSITYQQVRESVAKRDELDLHRKASPYRAVKEKQVILRTDILSVEQCVHCIGEYVHISTRACT